MLIETKELYHVYMPGTPFEIEALCGINLSIRKGEFIGIIGQTGSGKTTLVQHFNGLLKPTRGKVLVEGKDLSDRSHLKRVRKKIGLLFQYPEYQLFEETVYKDVSFGLKNLNFTAGEIEQRVKEALELVELDYEEVKDRSPFELSGGQMRRVAFAGVLAMHPEVLILDEPTAGMDPAGKRDILRQLEFFHHQKGLTVILVTHNMEDAARLADRIFVLHCGKLVLSGSPAEIFNQRDTLVEIGLGLPPLAELMQRLRRAGYPVRTDIFTIEEAKQEILSLYNKGERA